MAEYRDEITDITIEDVNGNTSAHSIKNKNVESIALEAGGVKVVFKDSIGVYNLSNVVYFNVKTKRVPVLEQPKAEEVRNIEATSGKNK